MKKIFFIIILISTTVFIDAKSIQDETNKTGNDIFIQAMVRNVSIIIVCYIIYKIYKSYNKKNN